MNTVGEIVGSIILDASGAKRGAQQATQATAGVIGSMKQMQREAAATRTAMAQMMGSGGSGNTLAKSYQEAQMAMVQLGFAAKTTGGHLRRILDFAGGQLLAQGIVMATSKLKQMGTEAVQVAGRVDEMNIVLQVLARNAGIAFDKVQTQVKGIKDLNIETGVAQNTMAKFIQNQIPTDAAAKLARVAQDVAVIGGMNSSQTLEHITWAITTRQTEMLRTAGLNVGMEESYTKFANAAGKSVKALTEEEKTLAALNGVLEEGVKLQGAYEESLQSPTKSMRSMKTDAMNLTEIFGGTLQGAFKEFIMTARKGFDGDGGLVGLIKRLKEPDAVARLKEIGAAISAIMHNALMLAQPFGQLFTNFDGSVILAGLTGISSLLADMRPMAQAFADALSKASTGDMGNVMSTLAESIGTVAKTFAELGASIAPDVMKTMVATFTLLATAVTGALEVLNGFLEIINESTVLSRALAVVLGISLATRIGGLGVAVRVLTGLFKGLVTAMTAAKTAAMAAQAAFGAGAAGRAAVGAAAASTAASAATRWGAGTLATSAPALAAGGSTAAAGGGMSGLAGFAGAHPIGAAALAVGAVGAGYFLYQAGQRRQEERKRISDRVDSLNTLVETKGYDYAISDAGRKTASARRAVSDLTTAGDAISEGVLFSQGDYGMDATPDTPGYDPQELADAQKKYKEAAKAQQEFIKQYSDDHMAASRERVAAWVSEKATRESLFAEMNSLLGQQGKAEVEYANLTTQQLERIDNAMRETSSAVSEWSASLTDMAAGLKRVGQEAEANGEKITAAKVVEDITNQGRKVRDFFSDINELAKKGLDSTALQDLLKAGPEAVGEQLHALTQAPDFAGDWISSINKQYDLIASETIKQQRRLFIQMMNEGDAFFRQSPEQLAQMAAQQSALGNSLATSMSGMQTMAKDVVGLEESGGFGKEAQEILGGIEKMATESIGSPAWQKARTSVLSLVNSLMKNPGDLNTESMDILAVLAAELSSGDQAKHFYVTGEEMARKFVEGMKAELAAPDFDLKQWVSQWTGDSFGSTSTGKIDESNTANQAMQEQIASYISQREVVITVDGNTEPLKEDVDRAIADMASADATLRIIADARGLAAGYKYAWNAKSRIDNMVARMVIDADVDAALAKLIQLKYQYEKMVAGGGWGALLKGDLAEIDEAIRTLAPLGGSGPTGSMDDGAATWGGGGGGGGGDQHMDPADIARQRRRAQHDLRRANEDSRFAEREAWRPVEQPMRRFVQEAQGDMPDLNRAIRSKGSDGAALKRLSDDPQIRAATRNLEDVKEQHRRNLEDINGDDKLNEDEKSLKRLQENIRYTRELTKARTDLAETLKREREEAKQLLNVHNQLVLEVGKATTKMIEGWKLTGEQFSAIQTAAIRFADTIRQSGRDFANITQQGGVTKVASGRAFAKMDEWLDTIGKLADNGLSPVLIRQLIDAGPSSLQSARRILSGGLIKQLNTQFARIENRTGAFTAEMSRNHADVWLPEKWQDPRLYQATSKNNPDRRNNAVTQNNEITIAGYVFDRKTMEQLVDELSWIIQSKG